MSKRFLTIVLALLAFGVQAFSQATVSGKVTDAQGEAVVGAGVVVKGTRTGTMTNLDGAYTLSGVPSGATLVFSCIGYADQEVAVGSQKTINVVLSEDTSYLDEVVVVAYGTAKRRDLTGAMTSVKSENLVAQSASSLTRSLEGSAPGLQVTALDAQPGMDMVIRVRGAASSVDNSAQALVVIDGVPAQTSNPLSNLNSADIESVSVLKDAASTALYGSRGANGVILITTKKGTGQKAKISFEGRWGWNSVGQFNMSNMTESSDVYEFAWKSIYNSYRYGVDGKGAPGKDANGYPTTNVKNPNYSHEEAAAFASAHLFDYVNSETSFQRNGLKNAMAYIVPGAVYTTTGSGTNTSATMSGAYLVNTDGKLNPNAQYYLTKEDEYPSLLKPVFRQEYNLAARGGSDKMDYYVSFGYNSDPSYVPTSAFKRYTARAAVNSQITKWLKVGTNIAYTNSKMNEMATRWGRNPGSAQGNVFRYINGVSPMVSLWAYELDSNGNIVPAYNPNTGERYENVTNSAQGGKETYSPLGPTCGNAMDYGYYNDMSKNKNETVRNIVTTRSYANINFLKDFNFLLNFNYDMDVTDYLRYRATGTSTGINGGIQKDLTQRFIMNTQQLLTYGHDFGLHHVDAMAGHEWNSDKYQLVRWASGYELIPGWISPGNFVGHYNAGGTTLSGSPTWSLYEVNMESYIGRANYNYDEKYFLSASVRRDGSSKFMYNKWGTFGSVGAGWVISKERFMDATKDVLDFLKVRGSYGLLGNQNGVPNYTNHTWSYGAQYTSATNGGGVPSAIKLTSGSLVNEQLTWEKTREMDFGVDFSFFNHRLSGAVDLYDHLTLNAFYNAPYSILAGSGNATLQQNAAKLSNRGFEIELSADIVRTRDFTFNVMLNGTHYRTILVDVPDETIPDNTNVDMPMGTFLQSFGGLSQAGAGGISAGYFLRGEGRDWYNLYTYKYAGVDQETGLPMYWHRVTNADLGLLDDGTPRSGGADHNGRYLGYKAGDDVKTTISGDASNYEVGTATPWWIGGFSTNIRYKNFDFSAVFAYQLGGKFFSTEYGNGIYKSGSLSSTSEMPSTELIGNTWTPENTDAYFPMQWWNTSYYDGSTFGSWKYTDMALFSASYIKLKNITVGYTLPKHILDRANIGSLRVYATADNLFYKSAKKGVDPSQSLFGGFEVGQYIYPAMRTVAFGVNVEF